VDVIKIMVLTDCVTSNGGAGETHELGFSSLPNTFPRVTKLANPIRESISSIVLDAWRETRSYNVSSAKKEKYECACVPCLHFTCPCNLFERRCF